MLLLSKRPTNTVMGNSVKKVVEIIPWLKDDLAILDYWIVDDLHPVEIVEHLNKDRFMDVQAIVNTGGSEGIYVDVFVRQDIYGSDQINRVDLMTLKSLDESLEAYASMGKIAGVITAVAETFLLINWKMIEEKEDT